jgi:hypothetical protein
MPRLRKILPKGYPHKRGFTMTAEQIADIERRIEDLQKRLTKLEELVKGEGVKL